jgi:hypothetical protein
MPEQDATEAQPIPFQPSLSGADPLVSGQFVHRNMVLDSAGALHRRPGIAAHSDFVSTAIDTEITGLHATHGGDLIAAGAYSGTRNLYRVGPNAALNLSAGLGGTVLRGASRPTFAETDALVVVAAGSEVQKVELSSFVSSRLGGGPPNATSVAANASRLLLNDVGDSSRVPFSATAAGSSFAGHEQWEGTGNSGLLDAEARPDPVKMLGDRTADVFVWGATTLQVFGTDPVSAYAAVHTVEYGISAPYSVVRIESAFAWIDQRRRIVMSDGRTVQDIGRPIQEILRGMSTVEDAYGYRVHLGDTDAYVWVFPTAGRTMVYQVGVGWGQWSSDGLTGRHIANAVTQYGADTLVGTIDGRIGTYSTAATDDLGKSIVAHCETAALNRGSENRKACRQLKLKFRRGHSSSAARALISWSDDEGPWSPPLEADLGPSGDRRPVVDFYALGVYRTRRWKFEFSGSAELILASAVETFEVLWN